MPSARRAAATRLLLAAVCLLARPARADGSWQSYTVSTPWHVTQQVVTEARPRMELANQYYELTAGGIEEMCGAQDWACSTPQVRAAVAELSRRHRLGRALGITGFATLGAGAVLALAGGVGGLSTHELTSAHVRLPLAVGGGLTLGGIGLLFAGLAAAPSADDVRRVVNAINAAGPTTPVHIGAGPTRDGGAAVMLSAAF